MLRRAPVHAPHAKACSRMHASHTRSNMQRSHPHLPRRENKPVRLVASQPTSERYDEQIAQTKKELKNYNRRFYISALSSISIGWVNLFYMADLPASIPALAAECFAGGISLVSYIDSKTAERKLKELLKEQKLTFPAPNSDKSDKI